MVPIEHAASQDADKQKPAQYNWLRRMLRSRPEKLSGGDLSIYRVSEDLSEGLIYVIVVFSPWAFGTTQPWSVWTMNVGGYLLGLLLACKLWVRWAKGYRPPRWDGARASEPTALEGRTWLTSSFLTKLLALLTVTILGYCLISALNARATFHRDTINFEYGDCILWLPHSLDAHRTWMAFWTYLGLACSFWAIRDWILGKTAAEERGVRPQSGAGEREAAPLLPGRLRRLLWVLAINGGLLGIEAIIQRIEGSGKLLFMVKPRVNPGAITQFGPWAYRSNAAQYFNLLWPVCLGFWWTLRKASRGEQRPAHHLLLVCALIMAACPVIATTRAGAIVDVAILVFAALFLAAAQLAFPSRRSEGQKASVLSARALPLFFTGALALGFALGWGALAPRMAQLQEGYEGREQMYDTARPMAADYPVYGTGPGTFESVFQLYRISTATYWPAQLHNDWLETRITFGIVGSSLIALAFLAAVARWFAPGGIHGGRRFTVLLWLSLAGCLAQARFDFPFQIHSIVFLFLTWCLVLSCLTRRP